MNTIFKDIQKLLTLIIVVGLIGYVVFLRSCTPEPPIVPPVVVTEYNDTTIYVHTKGDVEYIPSPPEIVEVEIPAKIDSAAIFKDYYTQYKYNDTIRIILIPDSTKPEIVDTVATVYISDDVHQNKIENRSVHWELSLPTLQQTTLTTVTNTTPPKNKIYWGAGLLFNQTEVIHGVKVGLLLQTKRDAIYTLDIGMTNTTVPISGSTISGNEISPFVGFTMYWKFKLIK